MREKMANLRKRGKDGNYQAYYQINGVRRWFNLHTKDEREAERISDELFARLRHAAEESTGLQRDIERFIAQRRKDGRYTDTSARNRAITLNRFGEWLDWADPGQISSRAVQKWYDAMREVVSETSALTYLLTVRAFFQWCVDRGIVAVNPAVHVSTARVPLATRERFCTPDERDFLIEHAPDDEMRFVLYCGFHAGMRRNEIVEARPAWFDLEAGLIHLDTTPTFTPKTRKPRTIPLSRPFREFLEGYGLRSPYMLRPKVTKGSAIYRYDFRRPFTEYVHSVGMGWVQPHLMRRTFASILASRDVAMHKIAAWLGDSVVTTERHYARLIPKDTAIDRML